MSKITAYTALPGPQPDDVLPVVDVHDTSEAASGTTKKITTAALTLPAVKFNVKNPAYAGGAKGDGSTDDTAAIQAAIAAAGSRGSVYFPAGNYVHGKLTINSGLWFEGDGYQATALTLKAGTNDNMIETAGFASLTGTDTSSAPFNFGIRNMTLDGNKAAQTGTGGGASGMAHVLAFYGLGWVLSGLRIRNGFGCGLWSEYGTATVITGNDSMESFLYDFKIHDCNGVQGKTFAGVPTSAAGIMFAGPHDTQILDGIVYKNGTGSGSVAVDFPLDGRANGSIMDAVHVWGGTYDTGIRVASSGISLGPGMQVEGSLVQQLQVTASLNRVGGKFFGGNINESTVKAIVLGDGSHSPNNVTVVAKTENCGGGVLDLTHSAGDHDITIHANYYGGAAVPSPAVIGSLDSNSSLKLLVINNSGVATADTLTAQPGALAAGANQFRVEPSKGYVGITQAPNTGVAAIVKPNTDGDRGVVLVQSSATGSGDLLQLQNSSFQTGFRFDRYGRPVGAQGVAANTPTTSVQAAAGSGASASVAGSDAAGTVTLTTGTGTTTGDLVDILFSQQYGAGPKVAVTPREAPGAALQLFTAPGQTGWSLECGVAPAINTTYHFDYIVIG